MNKPELTTVIHGGTIFAFNGHEHALLKNGVVVLHGDRIQHVGKSWSGTCDREIDARSKTVIPGQISTHAHIGAYEGPRCLIDGGLKKFIRTGFLHFMPQRRATGKSFYSGSDHRSALRQGFASLLRHGITTVVDYYEPSNDDETGLMVEIAAEMGVRLYWAPATSGGQYWLEDDGKVTLELDEARGMAGLERAESFFDSYEDANGGLIKGIVTVDEYYASTPGLRKAAKKLADRKQAVFTMHFLEQHREYFEDMIRTGKSPVQLLAEEGVLGANTLLAHCLYVGSNSLINYPLVDDIGILGAHGVSVAHSPSGYARRGVVMESFERYRAAGINMTLGTDMWPLEMFTEMRMASIGCKIAERNYLAAPAETVFAASNLAGAKALGRPDLGRLSAGAKADIVIVDTDNLVIGHNPDPLRAFVHFATADMVDTVMIDGRVLVEGKQVLVCDEKQIRAEVAASSERIWASYGDYHPHAARLTDHFPASLPAWEEPK
ncbi:putative hydrolase (plasmid) [Sinorhizobium fredii HH103]|uniref:Hydrolase n=1 Tax=Sinorhizobium fredii (strain HH103) TaxID=1117943 RepID=G9AJ88_SINF1|nr:amidohydrolase family protein [Sinorhizobium fredii]CCF01120.1 putative hydrolase [Sinorhizobium fredii HH103]